MLTDLYQFVTGTAVTGDPTRDTALATIRQMIGTRMYPDVLDEGCSLPAFACQLVSNTTGHLLSGEGEGILDARVQIDILAMTRAECVTLGEALRLALDGWIGMVGATPVGLLQWDNEIDGFEPDRKQRRRTVDFKVIYYADAAANAFSSQPVDHEQDLVAVALAGAIDGSNAEFALPLTPRLLLIFVNGILLTEGSDYTLNGPNVTFAAAPTSADKLRALAY